MTRTHEDLNLKPIFKTAAKCAVVGVALVAAANLVVPAIASGAASYVIGAAISGLGGGYIAFLQEASKHDAANKDRIETHRRNLVEQRNGL